MWGGETNVPDTSAHCPDMSLRCRVPAIGETLPHETCGPHPLIPPLAGPTDHSRSLPTFSCGPILRLSRNSETFGKMCLQNWWKNYKCTPEKIKWKEGRICSTPENLGPGTPVPLTSAAAVSPEIVTKHEMCKTCNSVQVPGLLVLVALGPRFKCPQTECGRTPTR